jgi:hypothetical protein
MKRTFQASLAVTLLIGVLFLFMDPMLRTSLAPYGIVSLELCAYTDSCDAMVAGWDMRQQNIAVFLLGIDYLFLLAYSTAIFAAYRLSLAKLSGWLQAITLQLAWLAPLAAVCDAIENAYLLAGLFASDFSSVGWPAALAATIKFAAVAITLLWYPLAMFVLRPALSARKATP